MIALGTDGGRATVMTGIEIGKAQDTISIVFNPHLFMMVSWRRGNTTARRRSTRITAKCTTEAAHEILVKIKYGRSRFSVAQSWRNVLLLKISKRRGSQIMVTIKSAIAKLNRR